MQGATPVVEADEGLFLKLECMNPGGSHKSRAARHIVQDAIARGDLTPGGDRIILEKTGGNLGIGLAIAAARHDIAVHLVIGLSFSPLRRRIIERYGAHLAGVDLLEAGLTPREVIAHLLAEDRDGRYHFVDQFNNAANVAAHYQETGPELVAQLRAALGPRPGRITFVAGVGSGASITGVGLALKEAFDDVEIVAVQPEGCDMAAGVFVDHDMQGIAVGAVPPIFRADLVDRWMAVSEDEAAAARAWMMRRHGYFPGNSSGANLHAVRRLHAARRPGQTIVSLIYDSGECYV